MTTTVHFENANFLRSLAESLPSLYPQTHKPAQIQLLQKLADDELAEARHIEWVQAKITASRTDTRPRLTTEEVDVKMLAFFEGLRRA